MKITFEQIGPSYNREWFIQRNGSTVGYMVEMARGGYVIQDYGTGEKFQAGATIHTARDVAKAYFSGGRA